MADWRGQPLARDTMAYVLAGGRGARLSELTARRAKPAVYFGGKARIIDFALSNAINSGIRRIGVATQYKAHSLIRHLQQGWNFLRPERNESFDILPASQRVSETQWYEGTADAVFQNSDIIASHDPEYIIILAGDHIYKMDYEVMLRQHCDQGADVTIACMEVPRETATVFGVMAANADGRITAFVEKPADPPPIEGKSDMALVSMGIYIFNTKFLLDELRRDANTPGSSRDFGKDVIPYLVRNAKAMAHSFSQSCVRSGSETNAYWRDVGTVDAYFEANIDLTDVVPQLDLYDRSWPLWTYAEIVPPAKFVHDMDGRRGAAISSLVSGDCIVSGSNITRSLLFTGVRANSYSNLEEAVILPRCQIGRGAQLRRVVIDRGVVIPPGLVVGENAALDAQRFRRTPGGVCLITQEMIDRLGMIKVLSVASEAFPLVKTGGLADVTGALPAAVAPHDVSMTTLLPGYPAVRAALGDARILHRYENLLGVEAQLLESHLGGYPLLVLDAPALYLRGGGLYGDSHGADWPDNWRRFAALARAGADLGLGLLADRSFDVLHAHDWQAALAPAYLHYAFGSAKRAASIVTIHNISFQGRFDRAIFDFLGLPPHAYAVDGVEYYGGVGFLKGGLFTADAITTVSPTYAREIRLPEFGMGLQGLITTRENVVSGIVNGIDPAIWNPRTDTDLAVRYTADTLAQRQVNKRAIEAGFNLSPGEGPLFTVVSRITWQKGMDVLAGQLDTLVSAGGRLALLGTGEPALEAQYRAAAVRHPGRIGVAIGYNEKISHLLQGGADAILIPSRFEPCGLTQLYGLSYGCVPVAARTGGLADTIIDANEAAVAAGVATGILFDGVSPESISDALHRTVALFAQPAIWSDLQRQGMKGDFSWQRSGSRYAALYAELLERART